MRVDKLFLPDYRNLRNFEIDFHQDSARTVLIGRNGVGKTNILEALTSIFRQLDLREKPEFAYRVCYNCNSHLVEAEAAPDTRPGGGHERSRLLMRFKVTKVTAGLPGPAATLSETAFYKLNSTTRLLPKQAHPDQRRVKGRELHQPDGRAWAEGSARAG